MKKLLSTLASATLAIGALVALPAAANAATQPAFTCSPNFYQVSGGLFYKYDPTTNAFSRLGTAAAVSGLNGIGYNPADNYVYGIGGSNVYRIGADGSYTSLGTTTVAAGNTATLQSTAGDFYPALGANMMLLNGGNTTWARLNVATRVLYSYTQTGASWSAFDFTVNSNTNKAYGLATSGTTTTLDIAALGATSAVITTKTVTGIDAASTSSWGAAYSDSNNNAYFFNNASQKMYKISAADLASAATSVPATLIVSSSISGSQNDGASCATAVSPFDPPTPVDDLFGTSVGTAVTVTTGATTTLVSNDQAGIGFKIKSFTFNGTTLTAAGSITGTNGTLNVTDLTNGYFTYTPKAGFHGTDSFTYDLVETAGNLRSSATSGTVTIKVLGATTASLPSGTAGTAYTATLAADGGTTSTYTWALTSGTLPAGLTLGTDGTLSGTPTESATARALTFTVTNGGVSRDVTLNLTLASATPAAPTVAASSTTTAYHTATVVTPTVTGTNIVAASARVIDPADGVAKTSVTTAAGTWVVNTSTGAVTFTPATGYTGTSSISYRATDALGQAGSATITVTTSSPAAPTVTAVSMSTAYQASVATTPSTTGAGVTAALIDPADHTAKSSVTTAAGTWTVNAGGTVSFVPAAGYTGSASISYQVTDAVGQKATATMTVAVAKPGAPTVSSTSGSANYGSNVILTPVVSATGSTTNGLIDSADGTAKSSVTTTDGTWTMNAGNVVFTPAAGFTGNASISYKVTDGFGQSTTVALTATVVTPGAPTVSNISGSAGYGSNVSFTPAVSATGSTTNSLIDPANGTAKSSVTTAAGTWTVNVDGSVVFVPAAGYAGTATISYKVTDAFGQSTTVTLSATVGAPSAPSVAGVAVTTNYLTAVTMTPAVTATGSYSRGLVDPADGVAKASVTTADGTWAVNSSTGVVTFTPAAGFAGTATIAFQVTDAYGQHGSATLSARIKLPSLTNTAPATAPFGATVSAQATLSFNGQVLGGRTVTRQRLINGVWTNAGTAVTTSAGIASFMISIPTVGDYVFRTIYAGNATTPAVTSAEFTITGVAHDVNLAVTAPVVTKINTTFGITATLTHNVGSTVVPIGGRAIIRQRLVGTEWVNWETRLTNAAGVAQFSPSHILLALTEQYRFIFAGDTVNSLKSITSDTVRVKATPTGN